MAFSVVLVCFEIQKLTALTIEVSTDRSLFFMLHKSNKMFTCSARMSGLLKNCAYNLATIRHLNVLGIETSCDDTGIALVNEQGDVLGNVLNSQQKFHTRYGGIIPPRAQDLHRAKIVEIFERCMKEAKMSPSQLDAIGVTTRPGLPLSLLVGTRFAKHIARKYNKPLVPVHHMEAHALQARMEQNIPYPFLCLLISGGHSQLVYVRSAIQFALLGESIDDAPGEAFDKIARRLRLHLLPKYQHWNGGQAVEDAAKSAQNPAAFEFPLPLARERNCNFSFAGIKNNSFRNIRSAEGREGTPPDGIIRNYHDFCSGLLAAVSRHLMNRTQRALEYTLSWFGEGPRSLVVSGGVANNDYIFNDLAHLAEHYDFKTYRPSKKYCSDNGVMIAWNAVEQIAENPSCLRWDYDAVHIRGKAKLGECMLDAVAQAKIKCKWVQASKWRARAGVQVMQ
ncbi:probable tRNA N6-adenosine threonylcarbamoyltransferase, mitochondrial isoform X2 [Anastrepha ludens]|uniref:probable tRNA N6-adenosine threonylcarbamoyltransferase, mitochondrial isoform X2 n=1 Tax=Anastrepha ludens TaxID=28586 RepID=UPI0023AFDEE9|nr:probable tRNA N6-adenosine threonylcarbamoyltransferase, mitochondrial isoform X2 [Anastrepha ludens]